MNKKIALISVALTFLICGTAFTANAESKTSFDGLELKSKDNSKMVYMAPDADFSQYGSILLMEPDVRFKKNWQRDYNRKASTVNARVSDEKMLQMKQDMKTVFTEAFTEEFTRHDYPIVSQPAANTIVIRPALIDLDVSVPDVKSSFMSQKATKHSGSATLYLELYDGVSGDILARVAENRFLGEGTNYSRASKTQNRADAKYTISGWARKLREFFDQAKATK
ncbi:DUF3313 family protein [Thalassotalea euphylliae]|uniref:DUF3313 family protein n=1 Tax=Thalassotalea euphylliae TaxID=1655234 RepID=UPI00362D15B5